MNMSYPVDGQNKLTSNSKSYSYAATGTQYWASKNSRELNFKVFKRRINTSHIREVEGVIQIGELITTVMGLIKVKKLGIVF